jgi:hypothetical protein
MSHWSDQGSGENHEADDDEEVEQDEFERYNADHIIILVDAREAMLQLNASGESHLQDTLKVILYILKQKIIARDNSAIGIMFLGTGHLTKDIHRVEFLPLEAPSAASVQKVQHFLDNFDAQYRNLLGGSQSNATAYFPLKEALWQCQAMYRLKASSNKAKQNAKRTWVFTNDDNPNGTGINSAADQSALQQVAKDCHLSGIQISLWCMDQQVAPSAKFEDAKPFDVSKFYERILLQSDEKVLPKSPKKDGNDSDDDEEDDDEEEEEDDDALGNRVERATSHGFNVYNNTIKSKFYKKRALFRGLMDFGFERLGCLSVPEPGAGASAPSSSSSSRSVPSISAKSNPSVPGRIAVQFFSDLKIAKKPAPIKLWAGTNEPLKVSTRYLRSDTGSVIADHDIQTFLKFGNDSMPLVPLSRREMMELRAPPALGMQAEADAFPPISSQLSSLFSSRYLAATSGEGKLEHGLKYSSDTPAVAVAAAERPFVALEVMYFVPASTVRSELNLKEPIFVFPNEKAIHGSTVLFTAVLQDLHKKGLAAMARFNGRDTSKEPRLVALLPVLETTDAAGAVLQAGGMHMITLPFRGEIRSSPQPVPSAILSTLEENPGLQDAARDLVRALSISKAAANSSRDAGAQQQIDDDDDDDDSSAARVFDYQNIESPFLQQFYAVLQGVALNETTLSWDQYTQDRMVPNQALLSSPAATAALEAFRQELGMTDDAVTIASGKRPSGSTGPDSKVAKKARAEAVSTDDLRAILAVVADAEQVKGIKVDGLKAFCKLLNLGVAGNKGELVEKLVVGATDMLKKRKD